MAERRSDLVAVLDAVSLDEVVLLAALQTRTDRKYIVEPPAFDKALGSVSDNLRALEIGGRRQFEYESVYFDTPDLRSYRTAATRRPDRFKIRTRAYLDDGRCTFEVKTRSRRGETVKHQMPYDLADREAMSDPARKFVTTLVDLDGDGHDLAPVLTTRYRRFTLLDGPSRVTIDSDFACANRTGQSIALPRQWIVETKSSGPATGVDRALWAAGIRPVTLSKFAVGMAGTDPSLPAHRWNRILRRYFGWEPDRESVTYRHIAPRGGPVR